jgi:hypothetical protein
MMKPLSSRFERLLEIKSRVTEFLQSLKCDSAILARAEALQ